ncbi:MAG: hypothetical protein IJH52_09515 [Oscillospiraceae bacterium]|nr:hypothetical protein [Oscillospiraceae bacterium]
MSEYRINVRFRLEDDAQRRAAEFLEHLDREQYGSRNAFAVNAICAFVEQLQNGNPNAKLLGDIRQIFREEVSTLQLSAPEPAAPKTLDVELTEAQKKTNARNVLAALEVF